MFSWILKRKTPLSVRQLLENTDRPRIKRSDDIRIMNYSYVFISKKLRLIDKIKSFFTKNKVNVLFVRFIVKTRNTKNGNTHFVVFLVPYMDKMDQYKLSELPIKIYSDTADFKFRMAHALNNTENLYVDNTTLRLLGPKVFDEPIKDKRTRLDSKGLQYDKHLYHVITHIDNLKL